MNARRLLPLIVPLLLTAILAAAYVAMHRERREELPTVFIDQPMPALPEQTLEGFPGIEPGLIGQGYALVNFWASWCPPCRAEHPQLMKLADEGWVIIGINKEDKPLNAKAFLEELGNPFAGIGVDPKGRIGVDWGVYGLPETFLIDANGRIRHRFPGAVTAREWERRFVPIIQSLEAEARPAAGQ